MDEPSTEVPARAETVIPPPPEVVARMPAPVAPASMTPALELTVF